MALIFLQVKQGTKIKIGMEIQYEFGVEDDLADPSYHQTKKQHDAEVKDADFQCIKRLHQNNVWVTSAKRAAVFQAHSKMVRKEAGVQLPNKDNRHSPSHSTKHLCKGGCCK